ncbi:transient receptor potential cation channel subfamily A member 1 homolog [Mya arenaria]|nr:transient receptor potential cation channel subfamily A member 1 homolog [Mya arenaria]
MDEFQDMKLPQGNYRSTINVGSDSGRPQVEMTDLPTEKPRAPVDEPFPLPEIPHLPRVETGHDVMNLTLHQCARNGDVKSCKILLSNMGGNVKKKINVRDEDNLTPLHYAARYNQLNVLKLLIDNHADLNARDDEDLTALHYAARFKRETKNRRVDGDEDQPQENGGMPHSDTAEDLESQTSVISYLVTKGSDVNVRDLYGQTPLHYACMRANEVACRELLKYRQVNIEAADKQGMTPLHMASSHHQTLIVKMLIRSGANLRCKDDEDTTPLHAACTEGSIEIVRKLFNAGAKLDGWVTIQSMVTDKDIDGNTCLSLAVENGHYEVVKLCLEKRADVNTPNTIYMYPLHLAAVNGDLRIVRLLIEHNARIDALNNEQATPLHKAAQYNHIQVVEFLVDREADIERRDEENYTPLLLASVYGRAPTVDLLIQKEADISAVDKNDKTAIFLAAEENQLSALEALLKYDPVKNLINTSDRYDNDPLHIAAMKGYLHIVRCLLKNGADLDSKNEEEQTPLHLAAKFGRTNIVRELVTQDKNSVNDEDESSNTALHLAALAGHAKVAEVLLEFGADVAARNVSMWTPLDCAAAKGWMKTAKVLLEADSPIDPMDKAKTTPLHLAARYGHVEVINLLLDWDADVEQRDSDGNNCLDLAIDHNNSNVATAIIKSDYWHEALRNHTLDLITNRHDTPMRKLIRKMPDVAEEAFNRCMEGNKENMESPNYSITFNYEFLDDLYSMLSWSEKGTSDSGSSDGSLYDDEDHLTKKALPYTTDSGTFKKNHPLMIMVNTKREDLLAHPLVTALLRYKWTKFGRTFYYINFFVYAIFLTFLTGYVVSTDAPYMINVSEITGTTSGGSDCQRLSDSGKYKQDWFSKIGKYAIIVLAAWNVLRELLQIYQAKLNYVSWENLIEWVTYVTSLLFVIDFEACQQSTGYRTRWQWNIGTAAIFLAWINLVLFAQKFPRFGIYVVMFKDILKTFIQFFVVFFLFIIAFALAFYCLLQNQPAFGSVWKSLIKTSVMMIGEFEYDGIYVEGEVFYKVLAYILFVVFMVVMSIIIMNLLVGLAVDNIKEVQEQAELTRKGMQVELALDVERMVPDFFRRKFVVRKDTLRPNEGISFFFNKAFGLASYGLTAQTIYKALNPELDELEAVKESQEKLQNTINKMRYNNKEMKGQLNNLEGMMKALMSAQGVTWHDEDFQESEEISPMGAYS